MTKIECAETLKLRSDGIDIRQKKHAVCVLGNWLREYNITQAN